MLEDDKLLLYADIKQNATFVRPVTLKTSNQSAVTFKHYTSHCISNLPIMPLTRFFSILPHTFKYINYKRNMKNVQHYRTIYLTL